MACCYIAASMIAFVIKACDTLNIDLQLQYNESVKHNYETREIAGDIESEKEVVEGVSIISITGMTCTACTGTVEGALQKVKGVQQALVSLPFQEARVFHDVDVEEKELLSAIEAVGYDAKVGERPTPQKIETLRHHHELQDLQFSLKGLSFLSTTIFILGKGLNYIDVQRITNDPTLSLLRQGLLFVLTSTSALRYGSWIFKNAGQAAVRRRLNMHSLISVSTVLGLYLSFMNVVNHGPTTSSLYYDTVVGVLFIVTVGRYADLLSRRQATNTFVGLYTLLEETASVKLFDSQRRVPTTILHAGDEIMIEPYSVVPCDSYVVVGKSHVNESVITGEAFPKTKTVGDFLLAGSRNGANQLRAMVNQDYQGSFLSQLVHSVEGSLSTKMSVQYHVDQITQYFVLVVFTIAFLAGSHSVWFSATSGAQQALNIAGNKIMTILSAACPCALGLATPCAIMAGVDIAWRKGILMLEGGETIETLKGITHIVMDKTGTLTQGVLRVSQMKISEKWQTNEKTLAVLVCAAEEKGASAHPVGFAIFRSLLRTAAERWKKYQIFGGIRDLEEVSGRGVRCDVEGGDQEWREVCVGSLEFMRENDIHGVETHPLDVDVGGTLVFVGVDGEIAASMILQDVVRPDSKSTIDALKAKGIEVSMLTGDNENEACRISKELGIPVMASSAMPEVKLRHIKGLQSKGHKVAMIGDGMNDGPSLAAADVGIMIAHGKKCLTSGGNVLILHSQLQSLLVLFDIAKSTMWQVTANITWALCYNSIALGLAIGLGSPFRVSITPSVAATMMSISSVFITLQGLLLRRRLAKRHGVQTD